MMTVLYKKKINFPNFKCVIVCAKVQNITGDPSNGYFFLCLESEREREKKKRE